MSVLVSPTDGDIAFEFGDEAITSSVPETKGADILAYTPEGLFGFQRKRIPGDFICSVNDGRLTRETTLLKKECKFSLLILEGEFRYYPDGNLVISDKVPGHYTKKRIQNELFTVKYVKGIDYDYTKDVVDTVAYIRSIIKYFGTSRHVSLFTRPSCPREWYVPSAKEMQSWILQSFDGIGPVMADHIVDHLGRMPLKWDCTLEELASVPRLSRKKAEEMYKVLNSPSAPTRSSELLEKLKNMAKK